MKTPCLWKNFAQFWQKRHQQKKKGKENSILSNFPPIKNSFCHSSSLDGLHSKWPTFYISCCCGCCCLFVWIFILNACPLAWKNVSLCDFSHVFVWFKSGKQSRPPDICRKLKEFPITSNLCSSIAKQSIACKLLTISHSFHFSLLQQNCSGWFYLRYSMHFLIVYIDISPFTKDNDIKVCIVTAWLHFYRKG